MGLVAENKAVLKVGDHSSNTRFSTQRSLVRKTVFTIGPAEKNTPSPGTPATNRTGEVNQVSSVASAIPIFRSVMKKGQLSKVSDSGHFLSGPCGRGQQLCFEVRNGQGSNAPTLTNAKRAAVTNCAKK